MSQETIRAFIAIELPGDLKRELIGLEASLRSRILDRIRWVDPNSIHLTLKFLGNISPAQLQDINAGLNEAARGVQKFTLEVRGLGAFPNLNRVQVIWVGIKGELDKLFALQQNIEFNMELLDFPKEERAFSPHLTLGRVRDNTGPDDRKKIGEVLSTSSFLSSQIITVNEICLMQSELKPSGAVHTRLSAAVLGD